MVIVKAKSVPKYFVWIWFRLNHFDSIPEIVSVKYIDNSDNDPKLIYRKLYDNLSEYLEPQSIPAAILLLADYQHKSAFVADQEINLTACLIELMVDCTWR